VLDVGTGGVRPRALLAREPGVAIVAGCDRSLGVLQVARQRTPSLRVVEADGQMLPFRDAPLLTSARRARPATGNLVRSRSRRLEPTPLPWADAMTVAPSNRINSAAPIHVNAGPPSA
jgi:SAM-dependent methyltransferase